MQLVHVMVDRPKSGAGSLWLKSAIDFNARQARMPDGPKKKKKKQWAKPECSHPTGLDTRSMTWRSIKNVSFIWYLLLLPTRQDPTQGQWPEDRLLLGFRGKEDRVRTKTRALLVYADHRPTKCNVGQMSLAGLWPKSGSRHVYLLIA